MYIIIIFFEGKKFGWNYFYFQLKYDQQRRKCTSALRNYLTRYLLQRTWCCILKRIVSILEVPDCCDLTIFSHKGVMLLFMRLLRDCSWATATGQAQLKYLLRMANAGRQQADIFTIKDAAVSVRQKMWMPARCEYSHCGTTILYASSSCSEWVRHHLWMDLLPLRNIHDSKQESAGHALVSPSS